MVRALLFLGEGPKGSIFRRSVDFVSAFTMIARAPTKKIATSIITVVNLFYLLFSVLYSGRTMTLSLLSTPSQKT